MYLCQIVSAKKISCFTRKKGGMKPSVPFTWNHGFPQGTIPIISSDTGTIHFSGWPQLMTVVDLGGRKNHRCRSMMVKSHSFNSFTGWHTLQKWIPWMLSNPMISDKRSTPTTNSHIILCSLRFVLEMEFESFALYLTPFSLNSHRIHYPELYGSIFTKSEVFAHAEVSLSDCQLAGQWLQGRIFEGKIR